MAHSHIIACNIKWLNISYSSDHITLLFRAGKSDSYLQMRLCPRLGRYWMYFRILGSRYQLLTRSGLRDSRWWNETARDTRALSRGPSRLRDRGRARLRHTSPSPGASVARIYISSLLDSSPCSQIPRYRRSEIGAGERYLLRFMITSPVSPHSLEPVAPAGAGCQPRAL